MYAIETVELTKRYGKHRGIEKVNLQVEEGEIYGFIGPNGAGKSTTIRTLLGLLKKSSGSATIFGKDCQKEYATILREVGYLPGEVFYYDRMRAMDLLNYAASFYEKDCKAKIKQLSEALDLDLKMKIENMSLGNRKKVGIIQGLLHSPKLIILDEPTSGLDPLMQQTFFSLIRQENANGATIFFSSHILREVEKLCDRVSIIKEGKIIQTSRIDELHGTYKKVHLSLHPGTVLGKDWIISGMKLSEEKEGELNILYTGEISALLTALAPLPVKDVDITEPDLEEVFLHFYQ